MSVSDALTSSHTEHENNREQPNVKGKQNQLIINLHLNKEFETLIFLLFSHCKSYIIIIIINNIFLLYYIYYYYVYYYYCYYYRSSY